MLGSRKSPRGRVEPGEPPLPLKDLAHHIGARPSRDILVDEEDAGGLLQRFADPGFDIEGQEGLDVHDLRLDARRRQPLGRLEGYARSGAVGDHRRVLAPSEYFGQAEAKAEFPYVVGQDLLAAIAAQGLDQDRRILGLEEGVVETGRPGEVAGHENVHSPHEADDARHRRARVPDPLEAVPPGAHDHRGHLAPDAAPTQVGEVVGHYLEGIEEVVEVLDLGDRPQAAQGHADGLAEDGDLADPDVGYPQVPVFLLEAAEALIDVA